jgi:membrane protease YdiL (CAAX protease family)
MGFISLANDKPLKQLISFLLIVLFSTVIFTGIGFIITFISYGAEVLQSINDLSNPESVSAMRNILMWSNLGMFPVPVIVFALLSGRPAMRYMNASGLPALKSIVFAIALYFISGPFIGMLTEWNQSLSLPQWLSGLDRWIHESEENARLTTEALMNVKDYHGLALNLLVLALLPAIGEELMFRSFFIRFFSGFIKNIHVNILLVSILFSAVHLQFLGFLPRFALGMMLGYFFYYSGSVYLPMLIHFTNNATVVIVYYLYYTGKIEIHPDKFGNIDNALIIILSGILAVTGFYLYAKTSKKQAELR